MYNQKYAPYLSAVTGLALASDVRGFIVAAAVAAAVAATIPIPTDEVISPESHFNANFAGEARNKIGEFNNVAVLNYDQACELVRKFWILRYSAVHGRAVPIFSGGCFAECFSGIKYIMSQDEIAILDANTPAFGKVRQSVATILRAFADEQAAVSSPGNPAVAIAPI